jgi:hypothetical protein
MENQLPFFVLEQFYDLIHTSSSLAAVFLTKYTANFFAPLLPSAKNIIHADFRSKSSHVHLLDFLHKILIPKLTGESLNTDASTSISISEGDYTRTVDIVSNLIYYGVRFKKGNGGLMDIQFNEKPYRNISFLTIPCLEIPYLEIDKNTIILFRNLLAYKVSDTKVPSYCTSYITFVSQILCSPRDVNKLRDAAILNHSLISDEQLVIEIRNCFNEFKTEYDPQNCYHNMQFKKLDRYKNTSSTKVLYNLRKLWLSEPEKTSLMLAYMFGLLGVYLAGTQTFSKPYNKFVFKDICCVLLVLHLCSRL